MKLMTMKISQNLNLMQICQHTEIKNLVGTKFQK